MASKWMARWAATLLFAASLAACGQGQAPASSREGAVTSSETHAVAVYVLSRGQGVPDATRAARDQARVLLRQLYAEKRALTLEETPIGLEGERRICATFARAEDAEAAAAKLRAIAAKVELFNVVLEPCAKAAAPLPPQGVKP